MSRDAIFSRIRAATAGLPIKTALPEYDAEIARSAPKLAGADLMENFRRNLVAAGGRAMESAQELADFLIETDRLRGYCDPALFPELSGPLVAAGLSLETEYLRERYNDYDFGITRASGAIAETGTLILDDLRTSRRLAALTPWVHIAVLRSQEIHATIAAALAHLGDSSNVVWATGPSKTADVEGILIQGVHGPGEQLALCLD